MDSNEMVRVAGFFLCSDDVHFIKLGDELPNYQSKIREAAYKYVKNWEVAIDVGGHVGIFSRAFSGKFAKVYTFEPMPNNRMCLEKNVPSNVIVYPYGLGGMQGFANMRYNKKNSGGSEVIDPSNIMPTKSNMRSGADVDAVVEIRPLDSFAIENVDLIKVDVQGMEEHVLWGAKNTLTRYKPVVILEEKAVKTRGGDTSAIERARNVIISFGYEFKELVGADAIYLPVF